MDDWIADLPSRSAFVVREPSTVSRSPSSLAARLRSLFENDPALFLERYGNVLTQTELATKFNDAGGDDNYEVEEPLADSGAEIRAELERLRKQIEAQAATKPTVKDATSFDPDAPAEVAAAVPELPGSFRATAEIRALKQNLLHSTAAQTKIGFWGMGGIGLRPVPVVGPFKGCDCRR